MNNIDRNYRNDFFYDSKAGIVEINGKEIKDITKLEIKHIACDGLPTITLEFNANVKVTGQLINKIYEKLI